MNPEDLLAFLRSRRSIRAFDGRPVGRDLLERLLEAAITAPSATNRQPWRFTVVTGPRLRERLVETVRSRVETVKAALGRSHHRDEVEGYLDFLWKPLSTAAAVVAPQYRVHPGVLSELLGPADPLLAGSHVEVELCGASAAIMALLLQAQAEGLGACWMTGPLLSRREIGALLGIREPWQLMALVPIGHPARPATPSRRRPLSSVVEWLEDGAKDDRDD